MPLYESLLQRLQLLPLSVTFLNALSPLLTSSFSHIPPPARGPAAFQQFFYAVPSRFSSPVTSYSDDLRVCIDACMRGYGGEWPSGLVPLSSQTQTQLQFQSDLLAEAEVTRDFGRLRSHMRSIEVSDLYLSFGPVLRSYAARNCTRLPVRCIKRGGCLATNKSTFRPRTVATYRFVDCIVTGLPDVSQITQ
jgi:hypothetical protein